MSPFSMSNIVADHASKILKMLKMLLSMSSSRWWSQVAWRSSGPVVAVLLAGHLFLMTGGGLIATVNAQEASPAQDPQATPSQMRVVLELGVLGGSARDYEVENVSEGPPEGEPQYVELEGMTIGIKVGLLDEEQRVIEVHLFKAAGEDMAQLLIEPGVTGYAEYDDKAIEVRLKSLGKSMDSQSSGS